jgi:hypothetical protein
MRKATLLLLLTSALAAAEPFVIEEGGQTNYLLLDGEAECHVVLRPESRLVFAFPSENSGAALIFAPGTRLHGLGVRSHPDETGQTVSCRVRTQGTVTISRAVLGSVRTLREQIEGKGADWVWKVQAGYPGPPGFARGVSTLGARSLAYSRPYLPGGQYQVVVNWPPGVVAKSSGDSYTLQKSEPYELFFTVRVPHPPLGGPGLDELTTPQARALTDTRAQEALRNLHFLTRGGKMMAGSWRFLTYFGRDTLLSLALLEPVLQPEALHTGLRSVLQRLSPAGEVAHEEELGDWAILRRIEMGQRLAPQAMAQPLYDYKMVDDDFLLPVVSARLAPGREWLDANRTSVLANWHRVLDTAAAGPVRILPGLSVGDWRDSQEGMGWGIYSGNVNHTLVPAALQSIAGLADNWAPGRAEGERARGLLRHWQGERAKYRVQLAPAEVRQRLSAYLARLDATEREFYLRRPVADSNFTLREFLDGAEALPGALSFLALSLDAQGRPVEVMNSDMSFTLFLGDPSRAEVDESLRLLELEYPLGLMTPVGPVVANPAFSLDARHPRELGRQAYHGAVIWSWQSAMLQAGLLRQWDKYQGDPELGPRLQAVIRSLTEAEKRAGALANAELWTHRVRGEQWEAVAFGAGSGDQTESNALQLWSTVYPANLLRLRQAGF